jgi:hypothetical protein
MGRTRAFIEKSGPLLKQALLELALPQMAVGGSAWWTSA